MESLQLFKQTFEEYLQRQHFHNEPGGLYKPINYIMETGGKRLRPILTMLSYQLYGENFDLVMPIAYTVELFHNFSLVHDDIMDEAAMRRNQPTVHHKFGTNAGILSGDVMLVYCYKYLEKTADPHLFKRLCQQFSKASIEVCEGQQMDMNFETRHEVSIEEYLKMIELKTAVLIACSLSMGATAGGAQEEDIENLYQFGRLMGIAFQLQDDILDTFGDENTFGKKVGGDILQNKKTYLVTKAMEIADHKTKLALTDLFSNVDMEPSQKIAQVTSLFHKLDIQQHAHKAKIGFQTKALAHLEAVKVKATKKQPLIDISHGLLERVA